jgi:hypothetical protein
LVKPQEPLGIQLPKPFSKLSENIMEACDGVVFIIRTTLVKKIFASKKCNPLKSLSFFINFSIGLKITFRLLEVNFNQ